MSRARIFTVLGTRPEVIKMAPVIHALERRGAFEHRLVVTAQHREMLDPLLTSFSLKPGIDLNLMQSDQSLSDFAERAFVALSETIRSSKPDMILAQGDTVTVAMASLASFYAGVRFGHVEAGLRSFDRVNPYPEEVNRRVTSCLASVHFAPTAGARANLLNEGVPARDIFVTGNTIVDALGSIPLRDGFDNSALNQIDFSTKRIVLVTAHRRENHGAPLRSICAAIARLAGCCEDVEFVYPVHLNPHVNQVVRRELERVPRVHLLEPISYHDLLCLMRQCYLVLTDSGGIQEEAPSFHKPVLVLREVTERPELIESGAGRLVGSDPDRIVNEVTNLLSDANEYRAMSTVANPFGDGHAAERIVAILAERLSTTPSRENGS